MQMTKRLLAMFLCLVMLFTTVPVNAFATGEDVADETVVTEAPETESAGDLTEVETEAADEPAEVETEAEVSEDAELVSKENAKPAAETQAANDVVKVEKYENGAVVTTTYHTSLQDAFLKHFDYTNNTAMGGTYVVTLLADCDRAEISAKTDSFMVEAFDITLDLAGHSIISSDATKSVLNITIGSTTYPATFTITDSVGDGEIRDGKYGIVFVGAKATLNFNGGTITNNHGGSTGGGICASGTSNQPTINLNGGMITGNSVTGTSANNGLGGGVFACHVVVNGTIITGNEAIGGTNTTSGRGGGIATPINGTAANNIIEIKTNTVYGNSATNSGDDIIAAKSGLSTVKHTLIIGTEGWYIDGWNGKKGTAGNGETDRYNAENPVAYTTGGFTQAYNQHVGLKYVESSAPSIPEYTVTYTDGVDGEEIFTDQVYTVEEGAATPAFDGTPARDGYTFAGWDPAVAETVTGDATYTATWKAAAKGEFNGVTFRGDNEGLSVELQNLLAYESVQVKVYYGETLLTTVSWREDYIQKGVEQKFLTVSVRTGEEKSTQWAATEWTPYVTQVPNKLELYIDGVKMDELTMELDAQKWAEQVGVQIPAQGEIYRAWLNPANGRLTVDILNLGFEQSVVLELYSGEELLTAATLNTEKNPSALYSEMTGSVCIETPGASSSWPNEAWTAWDHMVPTAVKLVVDGQVVSVCEDILYYDGASMLALTADLWAAFPGTKALYTVTYTDGVEDAVIFEDQTKTVAEGEATPAFEGTRAREGYTFVGWEPAVADTVTGNVTYVAQWKENARGDINGVGLRSDNEGISLELHNVLAYESIAVKVYSGETLLTTVSLRDIEENKGFLGTALTALTVSIRTYDESSSWAATEWEPTDNIVPDKYELYIDGVLMDTHEQAVSVDVWNALKGTKAPPVARLESTGAEYETLQAALDAAKALMVDTENENQTVTLLADIQESVKISWATNASTANNFNLTIDLNGHTVTGNGGPVFDIGRLGSGATSKKMTVTFKDSVGTGVVTGGNNTYGGAIYVSSKNASYVVIEGGTWTGNHATSNGGAISSSYNSITYVEIRGGTFINNTADGNGGAIYARNLTITGGVITGNSAAKAGGGIYAFSGYSQVLKMTGGAVYGNTAGTDGDDIIWSANKTNSSLELIDAASMEGANANGWYNDGEDARFSEENAVLFADYAKYTTTNVRVALKAAYVAPSYTVTYTDGVEGEEVFADQVYTVKEGVETPAFEGTPVREGYNFLGWEPVVAETVTADATYVAQWEKALPAQPELPLDNGSNVTDKLITIVCDTDEGHTAQTYGWGDPAANIVFPKDSEPVWDEEKQVWTIGVRIDSIQTYYVGLQFNKTHNGIQHEVVMGEPLTSDEYKRIDTTLVWDAENAIWTTLTGEPFEVHVTCQTAPEAPQMGFHLNEFKIKVVGDVNGEEKIWNESLHIETVTVSEVKGNRADGFTVDVTVTLDDSYLAAWIAKHAEGLDYAYVEGTPETVTFRMKYTGDTTGELYDGPEYWAADGENVYTVSVEVAAPAAPDKYGKNVTPDLVRVICDTDPDHAPLNIKWQFQSTKVRDWVSGVVWSDEYNTWIVPVRIDSVSNYYVWLNFEKVYNNILHPMVDEEQKCIDTYLKWDAEKELWVTLDEQPIPVHVTCKTAPDAPAHIQLKNYQIKVWGTVNGEEVQQAVSLPEGSYTIGEVKGSRKEGFTVDITVPLEDGDVFINTWIEKKAPGAAYVYDWDKTAKTVTFTLIYNGDLTGNLYGNRHASNTNYDWIIGFNYKDQPLTYGMVAEAYVQPAVAKIESTGKFYATLQAALDDAKVMIGDGSKDETVTLLADTTECVTVKWQSSDKNSQVTIDLNGFTVTGDGTSAVFNFTKVTGHKGVNIIFTDSSEAKTGTVTGGVGSSGKGGAVFMNASVGTLTINGGIFTGNTATTGGALYASTSNIVINGGIFTGNTATSSGGAVWAQNLMVNGGKITGNTADKQGGGIYVKNSSAQLNVQGGEIFANTAGTAGNDIYFTSTSTGGSLTLTAPKAEGYTGWFVDGYLGKEATERYSAQYNVEYTETNVSGDAAKKYCVALTAGVPSYTVSFDSNGGTAVDPIHRFVGETYGELPETTKEGYTFAGWTDAEGNAVTAETVYNVAADSTLTANWTANEYKVTFNTNGGAEKEAITVTYDGKYPALNTTSLTGFTASDKNWYLVDENGNVTDINIKRGTVVTTARDHELFLMRDIFVGAVKVERTPAGTYVGTEYTLTATVANLNTDLLNYTYQWYKDGVAIEGATEATLVLAGNYSDNGDYTVTVTATKKDTCTVVTGNESASKDGTYTLKLSKIANTLRLNENYGEKPVTSDSYTGGNSLAVRSAAERTGYTFLGWNTAADGSGTMYQKGDTVTFVDELGNGGLIVELFAQWMANEYKLNLDAGEGAVDPASVTVSYETAIGELPVPTRTGYTFAGWFDAEGKEVTAETVYTVLGDTTVTAKWTVNTYTLTLDAGEGTVEPATVTVTYGAAVGKLPEPTLEGYTFAGWTDAEGKAVTAETVYTVAADSKLTAKWTANTYTLTLDAGEGTVEPATVTVTYGAAVGKLPEPTLEGYTFAGWTDAEGNPVTAETVFNTATDAKLTAVWEKVEEPVDDSVIRVYGADRYETAMKAADMLQTKLGVEKFNTIVVACGTDFADALSGSYLANQKHAPILLVRRQNMDQIKDYIRNNLSAGGTVYLLGGTNAIPAAMETGLDGFNVKRLGGATRYDTNLAILKEAGINGTEVLVCTGKEFADGLSASAVNKPILLVKDSLTAAQTDFLQSVIGSRFYIIGGTNAISARMEKAISTYGQTTRIDGATRYETSANIAKVFFGEAKAAVLAYGANFPDGLSGGPLAYSMGAPLILTAPGKDAPAVGYTGAAGITNGVVLGGKGLINDAAVRKIFAMAENAPVVVWGE